MSELVWALCWVLFSSCPLPKWPHQYAVRPTKAEDWSLFIVFSVPRMVPGTQWSECWHYPNLFTEFWARTTSCLLVISRFYLNTGPQNILNLLLSLFPVYKPKHGLYSFSVSLPVSSPSARSTGFYTQMKSTYSSPFLLSPPSKPFLA